MIHYTVYLEKYSWEIEVYIVIENANIDTITDSMRRLHCSNKVIHRAHENIMSEGDSGFTYTDMDQNKSLIVINRSSNMQEFINTFNHEKNHVEMHICEVLGIDPYSETAAYLSGDIAQRLFLPAICSLFV